jgi:hypothetical protein
MIRYEMNSRNNRRTSPEILSRMAKIISDTDGPSIYDLAGSERLLISCSGVARYEGRVRIHCENASDVTRSPSWWEFFKSPFTSQTTINATEILLLKFPVRYAPISLSDLDALQNILCECNTLEEISSHPNSSRLFSGRELSGGIYVYESHYPVVPWLLENDHQYCLIEEECIDGEVWSSRILNSWECQDRRETWEAERDLLIKEGRQYDIQPYEDPKPDDYVYVVTRRYEGRDGKQIDLSKLGSREISYPSDGTLYDQQPAFADLEISPHSLGFCLIDTEEDCRGGGTPRLPLSINDLKFMFE